MEAEEGEWSQCLTTTGMAVVKRLIQSNRESLLASTGPLEISAPQQAEIIRNCYETCMRLVADGLNGTPYATVSMDEASRLILNTLLILQDERPPPPEQLCLGLFNGLGCGQQITRIRKPLAADLLNLDVTVRLRRQAGSYVVTAISMYPGIRLCNHPRLCDTHEGIMSGILKTVLLSKASRDEVNGTSDEIPTGFRRNRSWTMSTFYPDQDTELITAFVDQSFKIL